MSLFRLPVRIACLPVALALLASLLHAAPPPETFVGVVYNLFHEEFSSDEEFRAQVDRDVPAMARAGFTHVLVFPLHAWDPATRQRTWGRTDHLVAALEREKMKFIPLLLKEEQCSHYFPIWEFNAHPWLLERHQRADGGRNTRENVDFADPRILPLVEEEFRAVAERYGKSPALAFYNIWNEPHYSSDAPHVVSRFREWLRSKYKDLAGLRRAWGEDYTSWDEVSPFLNDDWNSSMPAIDWRLFRGELNGRLLGELAALLRKYDPHHPINANPVGAPLATGGEPGGYNTDNWHFTPYNDFNGLSYYPDAWERDQGKTHPLWLHNLSFTAARCASGDKGYVLTELYTNAKNGLSLDGYLDGPTLTRLSWTALANDAKGIVYWKWEPFLRGRQSLGRGLVRLDGTLAPRGQAAAAFARQVAAHGTLLRNTHPVPAQVGLLVDQAGLLKVLDQPNDPRTRNLMNESLAGVFRALDQANVPCDVLRADLEPDSATLARYRVLVLPFQVLMRAGLASKLAAYVRAGGCLIADARTASIDEVDIAFRTSPGAGLAELFGARRVDWSATRGSHAVEAVPGAGLVSFHAKWFRESLHLEEGTEVLARFSDNGEPALVSRRQGAGRAVLAACLLGASSDKENSGPVDANIVTLCRQAGVLPPVRFAAPVSQGGAKPSLKLHQSDQGLVLYAINPGTTPLIGTAFVETSAKSAPRALELRSQQPVKISFQQGVCEVPLTLGPSEVQVIWIKP